MIKCPKCFFKSEVLETRGDRRKRRCLICGATWKTEETVLTDTIKGGMRWPNEKQITAPRKKKDKWRFNWKTEPSCLDAAYERRAVEDGMNNNPVFPENDAKNIIKRKLELSK